MENSATMKYLLLLAALPLLAQTPKDPAWDAYQAWQTGHQNLDYKAQSESLFDVSAKWVAQWPGSQFAWEQRREALVRTRSSDAKLWKQVGENIIRLYPPHAGAPGVAYDWVTAGVNVKDAEALLTAELAWQDDEAKLPEPATPTLTDLIEAANRSARVFGPLCTLTSAEIQLQEYAAARSTISRVRQWLDTDFERFYDPDPLSTFPDYRAKYWQLSGKLAEAEKRNADALAYYHELIANPYYRRAYGAGILRYTRALWDKMGGTDAGWAVFSAAPPLPPGVPSGYPGVAFLPWHALNYKLPPMDLPAFALTRATNHSFEGKSTVVYLWASWCGPCWSSLPAVQSLYDQTKDRKDFQVVTLSIDDDIDKLTAFMREKKYTFPVAIGKAYVDSFMPQTLLGQVWIVDRAGSIRLQRAENPFRGIEQAFADELLYKLNQIAAK
jgi:thiol-disulfide isomerase/thioredoxin